MNKLITIISILFIATLAYADSGSDVLNSQKATINLSNPILNEIDNDMKDVLFRYLSSSPRWEVRYHKYDHFPYAILLRKHPTRGFVKSPLNAYYVYGSSNHGTFQETGVRIAFDQPTGYFQNKDIITKSLVGKSNVPLNLKESVSLRGTKSEFLTYKSNLIIESKSIIIEINERSMHTKRVYTQKIFDEISEEIEEVLKYQDLIISEGVLPEESKYYFATSNTHSIQINSNCDGRTLKNDEVLEGGIFSIEAVVCPQRQGYVYAKLIDLENDELLSEKYVFESSKRAVGWSDDGSRCFPYLSRVTVYEGGFSTIHDVRIELWHNDVENNEIKLIEVNQKISGWER